MLNRWRAPSLQASARTGVGVYEALEKITLSVLASFESQMPESVRLGATPVRSRRGRAGRRAP